MTFGEKLAGLRTVKKMTQVQVADAIGISRRTYIGYEREGRFPRHREVYSQLAEVLGCSINYLMAEEAGDGEIQDEDSDVYRKQAGELVSELSALFVGGSLSEEEKDSVMITLQKVYFDCKAENPSATIPVQ